MNQNKIAERVWQICTLMVIATIVYLILGGYVRFKKTKPQDVAWDAKRDGTNMLIHDNVFMDLAETNQPKSHVP